MKLNEKGFSMAEMMGICLFVASCLLFSAVMYQKHFNENQISETTISENATLASANKTTTKETDNTRYLALEDYLVENAKTYIEELEEKNSVVVVTSKDLISNKKMDKLIDPNEENKECLGYVIYKKDTNNYKGYVRCKDTYATENYNPEFE